MSQLKLSLPDGSHIPYQLERRTRRTIGMRIGPNGLVVQAPRRISVADLESLLISKANWIQTKLNAVKENAVPSVRWEDGEPLLMMGQPMALHVVKDTRNRMLQHSPGKLVVATSEPENTEYIAHKVTQWYRQYALQDFKRRLDLFSARLREPFKAVYISNAKSRWGSCNSKREIRLNWRLIQAPPHMINYVICHELAHLVEMNHSSRFWAIVEKLCPDYQQAEADLKTWSARLHAIDTN